MLYRLPSEFCAYFTPFLGLSRRWLGPVGCRGIKRLTGVQQRRVSHCHRPGDGLSWYFSQIQ